MAASFSEDIFTEILKRLPVSSVIKFSLVQKSWYHFIQSPYFNTLYSRHQKNTSYILFHSDRSHCIWLRVNDKQCNQYSSLAFPQDIESDGYRKIHGISNGLICVGNHGKSTTGDDYSGYWKLKQIYLWNPIIRKYKTLPHSPILYDPPCRRFNSSLAFGYVQKINDYKLIEIVKYLDEEGKHQSNKVGVLVYSLSTNSWKTVSKDNFAKSQYFENPVIVNTSAYWVGTTGDDLTVIVCFDIENEIIREIMLPSQCSKDIYDFEVTLVQNFSDLFLFYIECRDNRCILDIWILEKEALIKDVWRKKITLDLQNIAERQGWYYCQCFRNNNEIIMVNRYHREYMSYDIENDEPTEIIGDLSDLCSALDISAGLFVENLVLLGDNS